MIHNLILINLPYADIEHLPKPNTGKQINPALNDCPTQYHIK